MYYKADGDAYVIVQSTRINMINIPLDGLTSKSRNIFTQKNWGIIISFEWLKQLWPKMSTALSKVIYRILRGTWHEPMCDLRFLSPRLLGFILEKSFLDWVWFRVPRDVWQCLQILGAVVSGGGWCEMPLKIPPCTEWWGPKSQPCRGWETLPQIKVPLPFECNFRETKPVNQVTSFKWRVSFLTVSRERRFNWSQSIN